MGALDPVGYSPIDNRSIGDYGCRAGTRPAPKGGLGNVVGAFKSITTHEYIVGVRNHGWQPFHKRFWQRNYYEHIIRNQGSLQALQRYILHNPETWKDDQLHPNVDSQ